MYAKPCSRLLKALSKPAAVPCPRYGGCYYPVFRTAYTRRFRLNIHFFGTHIQTPPTPLSTAFVIQRRFAAAYSTPALLPPGWVHGQYYLVHLGVADDVLQDKSCSSDDVLNKFLGSHFEALFHDSLSVNKIIVDSPVLPSACSVFFTHTFYR
jgi:hypothetical protein